MHYLKAGQGPAVILIHGYAETSRMWRPLIPKLAGKFTVIAPDLPGIGDSSIPEAAVWPITAAYARTGRMQAGWAYFVSSQQAAKDFAELSKPKLTMPVLAIGGGKANGTLLGQQMKLVATNVTTIVLKDTGHGMRSCGKARAG